MLVGYDNYSELDVVQMVGVASLDKHYIALFDLKQHA